MCAGEKAVARRSKSVKVLREERTGNCKRKEVSRVGVNRREKSGMRYARLVLCLEDRVLRILPYFLRDKGGF